MKVSTLIVVLALVGGTPALQRAVRGMFDARRAEFRATQALAVEPGPARDLRVSTRNGAVKLRGTDTGTIRGRAEKIVRAASEETARRFMEQVRVESHRDGDSVVLEAVWPNPLPREVGSVSVSLQLEAPRGMTVNARSSNGAVEVTDMARATLSTSNGGVEAHRITGELDASTSNGAVVAEEIGGSATLRTSNGAIHAVHVGGALKAHTSNGAIDAELGETARPPVELTTNNGGIHARVPARLSARLTAETSNGRVRISPEDGVRYNQHHTHAEATFGSGAGSVDLRTSNGAIDLERR